MKSFPARSGSGADFILAAPDAEPSESGELRKGPKGRSPRTVTAVCLHGDVKFVLGTIGTPQLREAFRWPCTAFRSSASIAVLPAGLETGGFAASLSLDEIIQF